MTNQHIHRWSVLGPGCHYSAGEDGELKEEVVVVRNTFKLLVSTRTHSHTTPPATISILQSLPLAA